MLLRRINTAGEVQGKNSKWLMLLVQKLRLLVEVIAAQEVQGKYTKCAGGTTQPIKERFASSTEGTSKLVHTGRYDDAQMFDTDVFDGEEVFAGQDVAEKEVSTADPVTTVGEVVTTASVEVSTVSPTATTTTNDLTLAQTLMEIRSARPKAKGITFKEHVESTTITTPTPIPLKIKDKGKAKIIELEKPLKRKDHIMFDEVALKLQAELQAELEEEERLIRQREEATIASWDNVQAMIYADYQMAQQVQAEEQEELTVEEKSKLFIQLLEARKKHFAALRAKEMRNKPPTKTQKRNTMSTYLKNMAGYKHNQLKNKSFDDI
ncbi:hypothetical protein Tco_1010339 [Tanacetum coccineum]